METIFQSESNSVRIIPRQGRRAKAETGESPSAGNDRPALMRQVTHNVKRRIMVGKLFGGACKYRG